MPHNSHSSQNASATGSAANSNNSTNLSSNGATNANTTAPNSTSGAGAGGSSSPGDDLGSADEVKVFKDEGEQDEEISSQNLLEEKSSLIDLTESEVNKIFLYMSDYRPNLHWFCICLAQIENCTFLKKISFQHQKIIKYTISTLSKSENSPSKLYLIFCVQMITIHKSFIFPELFASFGNKCTQHSI